MSFYFCEQDFSHHPGTEREEHFSNISQDILHILLHILHSLFKNTTTTVVKYGHPPMVEGRWKIFHLSALSALTMTGVRPRYDVTATCSKTAWTPPAPQTQSLMSTSLYLVPALPQQNTCKV